jgi:uncharacterized membrane protein
MVRKALPFLVVLILLGTLLPGPASLAGPPVPVTPQPFPFSDRYPAEVVLTTPEMLSLLVNSGVDIGNVRPLDPNGTFPRPGEPFVPLVATVYINAEEATLLAGLGLTARPIDNPSVPDYPGGPTACSGWPSYTTLVTRMQNLANAYPNIVRLVNIGTSVNGRTLWMLKITDNPDVQEDEPEFRYSSTLHGTEGVGTEMTLRLAELLTSSYGAIPTLTQMVDEMEIWLWPVSNPDGYEACSYGNAHGINLNRDFPDRFRDPNNTPDGREPETQAAWYFEEAHTIVMGANYHTGALVANFPWDAITPYDSPAQTYAPDDAIFINFAEGYTSRNLDMWNNPEFYHGWTRGWEWYQIWGGMQDWAYNWYGEHHITLEISGLQPPPYSQMDDYWDANRDAMLWWMERVLTGARGLVTDACTGAPLDASVDVAEILKPVPTDPDVGDYHRLLLPGTYTLIASAAGYQSQSASVTVVSGTATVQDFALAPGSTYTVQGTVTDATSGAPLAATVELVGTQIVTPTNPVNGHYVLHLCPGTYTFRVSAPRHRTEERQVNVNGNRTEDFALAGYDVAAGPSERAGAPGETVTHTLAITNIGGMTDTYSLTLAPGAWPAALLQDQVGPLAPGENGQAQVVVHIPASLLTSTVLFSDVFFLAVTSTAVPEVGAQAAGTTYAIADLAVALGTAQDSLGGPAGHPLTYTLRLTNTGAYTDSYTLAAQGNSWPTSVIPPQVGPLGPGSGVPVLVRVDIPGAPGGPSDTVAIQATSGWDASIQARQTLLSTVLGAAVAAGDSQVAGAPGETVTHTLVVTNAGSFADTYDLTLGPGDWPAVLLAPQVGPLEPGESGQAQVAVHIPYQPLTVTVLFSDVFSLYVTSTAAPAVGTRATGTTYAAADLAVALVADRTSGFGLPGQVVTYTLTVTNAGAYTDSYALTVLPGSIWPAAVTPTQTPVLAPGDSARAWVRVSVPRGMGGTTDPVAIRAQSGWNAAVRAEQLLVTQRGWCIFLPVVVK